MDTSVPLLTLPQELVKDLGLDEWKSGTSPRRPGVVGPVTVRIGDRQTLLDCLIGPPGTEPVVGSTVLAV